MNKTINSLSMSYSVFVQNNAHFGHEYIHHLYSITEGQKGRRVGPNYVDN